MREFEHPLMIQIGSTGRNSGKTTMAKKIIERYKSQLPIYGLKIITISGAKGACQRGVKGCGICTSISEGYELVEETETEGNKDTMQLLKAGCEKVFLLKVFQGCLEEAFQEFIFAIPKEALLICESNSLRNVIQPDMFIMMDNQRKIKPSAADVIKKADKILNQPFISKDIESLIEMKTVQLT